MRARVLKKEPNCLYCGEKAETADHFIPLARGGEDTEANLVGACQPCNLAKGDRMPAEFMAERAGAPPNHQRSRMDRPTDLAARKSAKSGGISA